MSRALRLDEMRDPNTPIAEVVPSFMLYLRDLDPDTAKTYAAYVKRYASWLAAKDPARPAIIGNVEAGLADAFLDELSDAISPQTGKPYSSSTQRYAWAGLKQFGAFLADRTEVRDPRTGNVLATVRCPKLVDKSRVPLTKNEVERVLFAARKGRNGERNWSIYSACLVVGFRRDELIGLNVGDVCFDGGFVHVRAETSKFNKERWPTLWPEAAAVFDHYIHDVRPGRPAPGDPLFLTEDGDRMTEAALRRMEQNTKDATGIEAFCLHQLRHTWATRFKENGCGDDTDLMREAGWTDLRMVRRYSKETNAARRNRIAGPSPADGIDFGLRAGRLRRAA